MEKIKKRKRLYNYICDVINHMAIGNVTLMQSLCRGYM